MKALHHYFVGLTFVFALNASGAGRQLTGPHAPAASNPLSPEQAQNSFSVPEGFEVRLFAAEPDVVNPVAMTWDARGRLWVLELFEYPQGAPAGTKPRDQIKILEDTDADGRVDRVKVFADGLNLATGLLLGDGGVYVGQAPHLLFLQDLDGDDVADKRTILKTGFGLEDRHELLNGFTWGPDGWLYLTHGVFTHSKVRNPDDPEDDGVIMNAAVARYRPRTKEFEVFADGTSNPWGVDFDRYGNAFVSACVIDHLFHMAPAGLYTRQGGQPEYRYAYELLPSIVDHKHYRAAYCGVQVYQGNQYPEKYSGRVLMGNIHANAVNMDSLTPDGSSFKAHAENNFLQSNDGWFRPVSEQVGPDGALWIADWYDKYPCYQNAQADPDGVDRSYGRIWRVVYTGEEPGKPVASRPTPGMDLSKLSTADLAHTLAHPNVWHREMAQKLLADRRDDSAKTLLINLLGNGETLESRLAALWTLHSSDQLDDSVLDQYAGDPEFAIRTWVARLTGERGNPTPEAMARLVKLAGDHSAPVRLAVATALRQFTSGALTVNRPPRHEVPGSNLGPAFVEMFFSSSDGKDPLIPFVLWMAAEPVIADNPEPVLNWLAENGAATRPLSETWIYKTVRRICDAHDEQKIDLAVQFLNEIESKDSRLAISAIDGLLDGQQVKAQPPSFDVSDLLERLLNHGNLELKDRAQRLGALWGNQVAIERTLALINDASVSDEQRIKAIHVARRLDGDPARDAIERLLRDGADPEVLTEGIDAVSAMGNERLATTLIDSWQQLPAVAKRAAAVALTSRKGWTEKFLSAVEDQTIAPGEIPITVVRSLAEHKDAAIRKRDEQAIGRFREANADVAALIARKKRVVLAGVPDPEHGRQLAETTCLVCHKLHGKGADVGPDLTGVGRSTLDALLANVIDPNQIIGAGYENVEIETKDDRVLSGRLVEQTDSYVKLASLGPREEIISRDNIASQVTTDMSVMPEGLEQMPDQDFRDLIWFILNPPEDHRPMTPELRAELIGETPEGAAKDLEAVALWNPDWRVDSADWGDAPAKLAEFSGRKNVLMTHPFWHQNAAALERDLRVPSGQQTFLNFEVAAADHGKWVLRAFADEKLIHKQIIDDSGDRWKPVSIDLSDFAGQTIRVRLENYAYNLENDYGYWRDIRISPE